MFKSLMIALVASIVSVSSASAIDLTPELVQKLDKTEASIVATTQTQVLKLWEVVAKEQQKLISEDPSLSLGKALKQALANSKSAYFKWAFQWDDYFYCSIGPRSLTDEEVAADNDDIKFDYCNMLSGGSFNKDLDPRPSTYMGGLFWVTEGQV